MDFEVLVDAYEKIEGMSGRLEITDILADLFKHANEEEIDKVIYLSQGVLAPPYTGLEVGMGEKFVEEAISLASGYLRERIEREYRKTGDLGKSAENLLMDKKQMVLFQEKLSVERVFEIFLKIAKTRGVGSQELKIKLLAELLNDASPKEARYIVRFPIGRLRLGIGDPTILDALSVYKRGDKSLRDELERAYNLCSDLGMVAKALFQGEEEIKKFSISLFRPIRPALAERLSTSKEIIEKIGKCRVEAKYDGFRLQIHKCGERVEIFSRKLERITDMFPEIVEGAKKQIRAKEVIMEGEALAFNENSGEYYPFQLTIQRKRKYGIKEMAEEFPLRLFAFDLLYFNGIDYTNKEFSERHKKLVKIIKKGEGIALADSILTDSAEELEKYFNTCIERGLEGIIAKDLNAKYIAGARKFAWIKLKRSYKGELEDTIDVVIVGYFLGKGRRAKFRFGGILGAVYDNTDSTFRTVAKIGSGFTEEQMRELEKLLRAIRVDKKPSNVISLIEPDFWVELKYVITVAADEITLSPTHTCGREERIGYALRFPRMVGEIRSDKRPEDATSVKEIINMFEHQKTLSGL